MIVKDKLKLKQPCIDIVSIEEGEEIASKLFSQLAISKDGVGLAANQIGINKRVCVINVKEPLYFFNPIITETDGDDVNYLESCLSFPSQQVRTVRHRYITVEADNHDGALVFGSDDYDNDLFESVCIQHEIDHLNGITMFDRKLKLEPIKTEKKFGRNHLVTIKKGDAVKVMKYKKALPFLNSGDWEMFV